MRVFLLFFYSGFLLCLFLLWLLWLKLPKLCWIVVIRKDAWYDFKFFFFFNLPRLDLCPRMWSIFEKFPCALEQKVKFIVLGWNALIGPLHHLNFLFLANFLFSWSIHIGVLKSPTIIVLLLIAPFIPVSIFLMYYGAPMLGAYIIVISSSWIHTFIII